MALSKVDFKRDAPRCYAPPRHPVLIEVPRFQFLALDGCGEPVETPDFEAAAALLYTASYLLKFGLKRTLGLDWVVGPLEALWSRAGEAPLTAGLPLDRSWTLLIRQPDEVTVVDLERVRARVPGTFASELVGRLRLEARTEGLCVQVMHVGSCATAQSSVEALGAFIASRGLAAHGRRHEVYLSDPERTAPDRVRTVLRQPVRLAERRDNERSAE
ncbi:MAG: GyrI-like domain-containing protein [Dehalococcoidia bacterium]